MKLIICSLSTKFFSLSKPFFFLNDLTHLEPKFLFGNIQYSVWLKVKGLCCNSRYFSYRTSVLARIFRFYIFFTWRGHIHFIRIFEIFNRPRSRPHSFSVILCHDSKTVFFEKSINLSIHFMPKMNRQSHLLYKFSG